MVSRRELRWTIDEVGTPPNDEHGRPVSGHAKRESDYPDIQWRMLDVNGLMRKMGDAGEVTCHIDSR